MEKSNSGVTTAWSTGRTYSPAGQRISAKLLVDGRVAFYDADRMIDGITNNRYLGEVIGEAEVDVALLQDFLLGEYDLCQYTGGLYDLPYEERNALGQALCDAAKALVPLNAQTLREAIEQHGLEYLRNRVIHESGKRYLLHPRDLAAAIDLWSDEPANARLQHRFYGYEVGGDDNQCVWLYVRTARVGDLHR